MVKFFSPRLTTAIIVASLVLAGFLARRVQGARSVDELDSDFVVTEESETEPTVPTEDQEYQVEAGDLKYSSSSTEVPNSLDAEVRGRTTVSVEPSPIPWGCYEYRTGSKPTENSENETFPLFQTPQDCRRFCFERPKTANFSLYMIRGVKCSCFAFDGFGKNRVDDDLCNLDCPETSSTLKCGGNLVASVYCNDDTRFPEPRCREKNPDSRGKLSTEPEDIEDLKNILPLTPKYPCAKCTTDKGCKLDSLPDAEHDYFPANSALDCVIHCRSKLQLEFGTRNERKFYQLAVLRWEFSSGGFLPVCMCDDDEEKYTKVPAENCTKVCPGNASETCGNGGPELYTIYCTYRNCSDIPDFDSGDSSTSQSLPTTPNMSSTEVTSTLPTSTTLEPKNSSSESTGTHTPRVSTTTTEFTTKTTEESPVETTLSTTSSTSTTTVEPSCSVKCEATDHYGGIWKGCPGYEVHRACSNGKSGNATWRCLANGIFSVEGPDFSNCHSDWRDAFEHMLEEAFENDDTWTSSDAVFQLKRLKNYCKPTGTIKNPYFGHEILNISKYVVDIIRLTNGSFQDHAEVIEEAVTVPQLLAMNQDQWKDILNPSERASIATKLFTMLEDTAFSMAHEGIPENYSRDFYPERGNSSDFLITFASGNFYSSRRLQFPSQVEPGISFITMEAGWDSAAGDPTYVGVSLDSNFIKIQMPPDRFTGPPSKSTRNINSNMISLTLAGLNSSGKSVEKKKVCITFQHTVEAWGDEPASIQRKLHPGEIPKMVLGTAKCAYWSTEKLIYYLKVNCCCRRAWDTKGCKRTHVNRTTTICECDHLTSFALLMDQHLYVGKEKALEMITVVLCSLSAVSLLACIVAFTAIHSIKSSRTTITKHLCICLMIGILMLLLLVDRNYIPLPDAVCTAVGIGTHYVYLAAFMWMLIEGLHLYKMVVHVFDSGKSPSTIYKVIAYGVPVLMVGGTSILGAVLKDRPYGGDDFCWLAGPYIWAFIGPVAVVIIINIIILFIAMKTAYQVQPKTAFLQKRRGDFRTWIRGSFSITVILGITWLPGLFMTSPSRIVATVSAYLFVVLNASQGFFLFVHHCLLNEKVRRAAERSIFSSWLSRHSGLSKDFYQSGKRSENTIGRSTTASVKSINYPKGPQANGHRNKTTLYNKGHKSSDSSLGSEEKRYTSDTRIRNKGSDSSQRELVHR